MQAILLNRWRSLTLVVLGTWVLPQTGASAAGRHPDPGAIQPIDKSVALTPGQRVAVTLETGGDLIIHGGPSLQIRMHAAVAGPDASLTHVSLEPGIREARLRAYSERKGPTVDVKVEVWIPAQTDVRISSAGGTLELDRVDGSLSGSTGGGEITVRDSRGSLSLSTGGGDVHVSDSDLSGLITTGGGRGILERVTGGLIVEQRSNGRASRAVERASPPAFASFWSYMERNHAGSAAGEWAGACTEARALLQGASRPSSTDAASDSGRLTIVKEGGRIDVSEAAGGAYLQTGGGDIVGGGSAGPLHAFTAGGNVDVERSGGVARVTTGGGTVRIAVENDGPAERQIRVCSGHGPVTLTLPPELDATLRLETAYTDAPGRASRIESAFPVEQTETDWQSAAGDRVRFVRATGVAGSGRGAIVVQTVGGDIVIRRGRE